MYLLFKRKQPSCGDLAYVDKHFRSFFCRQNAIDLGEREEREVKD
jgi:hypothetical protein